MNFVLQPWQLLLAILAGWRHGGALDRAIALANTAAEAAHIRMHLDKLQKESAPKEGA